MINVIRIEQILYGFVHNQQVQSNAMCTCEVFEKLMDGAILGDSCHCADGTVGEVFSDGCACTSVQVFELFKPVETIGKIS